MSEQFQRVDVCPGCGREFEVTYEVTESGVRAVAVPSAFVEHQAACVAAQLAAQQPTEPASEDPDPVDPVVAQTQAERIAELEAKLTDYAAAKADLDAIIAALGGR